MTKILLIHNTIMPYRMPFFKGIKELYDVEFIFTHIDTVTKKYRRGSSADEALNELKSNDGGVIRCRFKSFAFIKDLFVNDYDLIVCTLEKTALIAFLFSRARGIPLIYWSEQWSTGTSLYNRISKYVIQIISTRSEGIIVPGTKHRSYFISLGVIPEKIFLVPNVHTNFQEGKELIEVARHNGKKIVLYAGRLIRRKGVDVLIQSFAQLRLHHLNIMLIIVGDGNCRKKLISLAKKLNIRDEVYFAGQVEDACLMQYYRLCDLCVIPSITYNGVKDPWVFVLNEAMYFGKPVIASDAVGAAFDLIKNGENGFVVPEGDADSLFKTMNYILSDGLLLSQMGKKSKELIEAKFMYADMINAFRRAIESVCNKERSRETRYG